MNSLSYQEALQVLRRAGFREAEIAQFYRLRQTYLTSELDQPPLDPCRLQFARWLVSAGRLTDELPTEEMANEPAPVTLWTLFNMVITHLRRSTTVEPV